MPQQIDLPIMMRVAVRNVMIGAILLATACSVGIPTPSATIVVERYHDPTLNLMIPTSYRAEIVARGLQMPTDVAIGPDNAFYFTQYSAQNTTANAGQIVRIKAAESTPEVLLEGLSHPTGLAWTAGALYIIAADGLWMTHLKADGQLEAPTALYQPLPYNTHLNGQISIGADGWLYFAGVGDEKNADHSGVIYAAAPDGSAIKTFARGLHDAYAIANVGSQMYATDVNDGFVVGVSQPGDELNIIQRGGDYGWPKCYANQQENHGSGGDRNICSDTDIPLAEFPSHSTPTGLAAFDGKLIVALHDDNPPRLVSVDPAHGYITEFIAGFKRPIALTTAPDSSLLVVDGQAGLLYRITKTTP